MTQEDLIRRMEVLLEDRELWKKEVRDGFQALSLRLTALESKIEGTGGIVRRNLCSEKEKACHDRLSGLEDTHKSLVAKVWAVALGAITGLICAIYEAVTRH